MIMAEQNTMIAWQISGFQIPLIEQPQPSAEGGSNRRRIDFTPCLIGRSEAGEAAVSLPLNQTA